MKIRDLMTVLPITIAPSASIEEAKRIMYQQEIRHLPVTNGSTLVGIITDRDLKLAHAVMKADQLATATVSDLCITNVYTCPPESPAHEVLDHLVQNHIGSALIVEGEELLGIFTVTDSCRLLANFLRNK